MGNTFIQNYAELSAVKRSSVRAIARKFALDSFSLIFDSMGLTPDLLNRPRIQFLYIHHIFKDEEKALVKLIEQLAEDHSFLSYNDAVCRILTGNVDKPYIAISSDDGLKNNLSAAKLLSGFGIRACFFICPPMIGEKNFEKIKQFSSQRLHLPPVEFMDWSDIDVLQAQGHEVGGHTMSHVNLALCSTTEMQTEIAECFADIEKRCGPTKHFAYPFGRYHHFNAAAKDIVFSTGFSTCASAERGCHIVNSNDAINKEDLFIRRDQVILSWPINHILYFMARNAQKASVKNNYFPL